MSWKCSSGLAAGDVLIPLVPAGRRSFSVRSPIWRAPSKPRPGAPTPNQGQGAQGVTSPALTATSLPTAAEHRPAAGGTAARDDDGAPGQRPGQDAVPLGVHADAVTAPRGHRAPCQQLEPSDAPHHTVLQQNHPETDSLTARGPGGQPAGSWGPGAQGQMDRREDRGGPGGRNKWAGRQAERWPVWSQQGKGSDP